MALSLLIVDIENDPDFKQWAAQVSRGLIPKLAESAASVALISPGSVTDVDVKHAVEIGFILLMGRPLILAVEPGVKVPAGLARAADRIVEYNPDEPERGNQRLQAAFDDLTGD